MKRWAVAENVLVNGSLAAFRYVTISLRKQRFRPEAIIRGIGVEIDGMARPGRDASNAPAERLQFSSGAGAARKLLLFSCSP
jgi:hypothetical protein